MIPIRRKGNSGNSLSTLRLFDPVSKAEKRMALEDAQELAWRAMEEPNRKKRIQLAKKAVDISPDCADALGILAEELASAPAEREEMYIKAVEAGERAIGKKGFKEFEGVFWLALETRPYMRAKHNLAMVQWDLGKREEAAGHFQDLLRLNPNDNQGVRGFFITCLIEMGRDEEATRLWKEYEKDRSAVWTYSAVLLAFRKGGDGEKSRSLLAEALKSNMYVPNYLLGRKLVDLDLPDYYSYGSENEAELYWYYNHNCWKNTPGAISWLGSQVSV